jgi:membrane-associated protease RseP (regulator of RpoE activity)
MSDNFSDRRSLVALLLGTVALVALLTWLGGWPLPVVIAAVLLMVMGHEFGHFITAKRAGLQVTDFFVGFGPVVWSITRGETRYGVRALPLGGYVKVPGMTWSAPVDDGLEGRTYRSASYPKKVLFASAGSLMHVVMALILAFAALTLIGTPSQSHVGIVAFNEWSGHAENAAQLAGMKVGDRIISINGRTVSNEDALVNVVRGDAGRHLTIVVERSGRSLTLHATPVDGRTLKEDGTPLAVGKKSVGYLGIELEAQTVRTSAWSAVPASFTQIGSTISAAAHAMVHVFSPGEFSSLFHQVASPKAAENRTAQLTRPESIVGVVRIAVQGTQTNGFGTLLNIMVILNIFVGMLNMLPMLPLDGGYVAVATYERLRSRRGVRYQADVNKLTPFVYAFMSVLLVLFACTLYLDIAHPIVNPFP